MSDLRSRLLRPFSSVGARLTVLIAACVIPVALLAAWTAVQGYQDVNRYSLDHVGLVRDAVVARHEAAIDGAVQLLGLTAQILTVDDGNRTTCDAALARLLSLQRGRYSNVAIVDSAGRLICSALGTGIDGRPLFDINLSSAAWFREVRETGRVAIGDVVVGPLSDVNQIMIAIPRLTDGRFNGALVAGLSIDWLGSHAGLGPGNGQSAIWLFGPTGETLGLFNPGLGALPSPVELHRLLDSPPSKLLTRSRDGAAYAYATARLAGGVSLIVGSQAVGDEAVSRSALMARLVGVAVLLLFGLAIAAAGVSAAVVGPLRRLTFAVRRWRAGEGFDPGPLRLTPRELRELSVSFAEAARALRAREAELAESTTRQSLLMQEIHHRVKNNLQIVASLLNLQASRIRQPEARAEFQAARDRVRALAILHRHLYTHDELHSINMRGFLVELCGQLFQAMGEREGQRLQLEIEAPELRMTSDQAVPLSLIVTEAVSNAVKYAFPGARSGKIRVGLSVDGEMAELVIEDNGVGVPAGQTETETGPKDGIGIQLIRGFVRQLGATLSVEEGAGTRYVVRLRLRETRDLSAATAEPAL